MQIGLDIGSTTIKIAVLDDAGKLLFAKDQRHYHYKNQDQAFHGHRSSHTTSPLWSMYISFPSFSTTTSSMAMKDV